MAKFQQVIDYVCRRYASSHPLDRNRLGLILYLVDWKSAIERRKAVTDIVWRVEDFGPRPDAESALVVISARTACPPDFSSLSAYVGTDIEGFTLTSEELNVIEFVITSVSAKSDYELQHLVHSTFPMLKQPKTAPLNLVALAAQYDREYRSIG